VSIHIFGLHRHVAAALALLVLPLACGPAAAANWLEQGVYLRGPRFDSRVPACDDGWALGTIKQRFAAREGRFWQTDLQISDFDRIREVAFRPWADGTVPRRFCTGRVLVSDGKWRTLRYSIIEDGGLIAASFGVHWCVVGLDRNWSNNPDCRAAGP